MVMDEYPVQVRFPVAWGQLDAFGHLNNTVYFRFFEDARVEAFRRIGVLDHMDRTGIGPILARTSAVFRQAVGFPDTVTCCARICDVGEDRFTMEYAVFSDELGLVAHGDGRIIMYDYAKSEKAPLPDVMTRAIEAL
jgi:acyl-CoA thioester hydrolase